MKKPILIAKAQTHYFPFAKDMAMDTVDSRLTHRHNILG